MAGPCQHRTDGWPVHVGLAIFLLLLLALLGLRGNQEHVIGKLNVHVRVPVKLQRIGGAILKNEARLRVLVRPHKVPIEGIACRAVAAQGRWSGSELEFRHFNGQAACERCRRRRDGMDTVVRVHVRGAQCH